MSFKLVGLTGVLLVLIVGCANDDGDVAADADATQSKINRLRSLPYVDFAPEKAEGDDGVTLWDASRAFAGPSLVSVYAICTSQLIDMDGTVLRAWNIKPCGKWSNAELQPNGDILAVGTDPPEDETRRKSTGAGYLLRMSWDGEVLWKKRIAAHHDIQPTPQGHLLTLVHDPRRIPEISSDAHVQDDRLTLLTQDGEVVESRSLYDMVTAGPAPFTLLEVSADGEEGSPRLDIFHSNSVEWIDHPHLRGAHPIYEPGNILVSMRNQNAMAVVNWDRQELVWSWGQDDLIGQHDADLLPNGNILVYDNGLGRRWSRILEIDPRQDGGRIVWTYREPQRRKFYSATRGSNQRLPNDNTLIADSDSGVAFEVTAEGERVWSWNVPLRNRKGHRLAVVRIERYARDASGAWVDPESLDDSN